MKKLFTFVMLATMAITFISCKPSTEDAIKYNDQIFSEQIRIIEKIDILYTAMEDYTNLTQMDASYADALKQVEIGSEAVGKLKEFGGNADFRDEAIKLFGSYKALLQNEIKEILSLNKLPDDQFTPEMREKMGVLNEVAIKKMALGLAALQEKQGVFAKEYKFEVKKSK